MSLSDWVRALIKPILPQVRNEAVLRTLMAVPKVIGADQRLFCFKDGRKTLFLPVGDPPRRLETNERCIVLPTRPIPITIALEAVEYAMDLLVEPDDYLAAALSRHGEISEDLLGVFCRNALDAVLPTLPATPDPERLRIRLSLELMGLGFRCVRLSASTVRPAVPPEPSGDEETLAADFGEMRKLAESIGVNPAPVDASTDLSERERLVRRMKNTLAEMDRKLREYREELDDTRAIEARLDLAPAEDRTRSDTQSGFTPQAFEEASRPFTALVLRRSDIDDKLRRYIAASLEAAMDGLGRYQREYLLRDMRLGGRAGERMGELQNCRARLEALAVLRHGFGPTRPDRADIRLRVKRIKTAANAAAGVSGAVAFLCEQPPRAELVADALRDVATATAALNSALKDAEIGK